MIVDLRGTFSICAADQAAGEVGVAVQSKYFAVGSVVPWAKAGVGAVATQAAGVAAYGPTVLAALERGLSPAAALEDALSSDEHADTRQLAVVSARGETASWTGERCTPWAGAAAGLGFTAQGNVLAGEEVVDAMARAFEAAGGSLAERLVAALDAGQAAGGDRRGQQSAALVVERSGAAEKTREGIDRVVDLRVDDHPQPILELRRLVEIHLRRDALRQASGHHAAGDTSAAIAVLEDALERFAGEPMLLYDLACYESLTGRRSDALTHLTRSLELDAGLRELAATDTDLDALRGDPAFARLTARAP